MGEIKQKSLSFSMTVLALVNGMIGGSVLVIPVTSLEAGWFYTVIIILLTAVVSFYSCYLGVIHMGDQKDLDSALLRHFNGSKFLKLFYDFCVWIGITLLLMLYFALIVIQWQGLAPPYEFSYVNVLVNGAVLVIWCLLLKFFQFGAHMMGYGVVSIAGYLIFLMWVMGSRPSGPKAPPAFGTGIASFASMMGSAFSIQGFFIPVIKSHPKPSNHVLILFLAYIIGSLAYYYTAFMGAYGIVNRQDYQNTGTIQSYFTSGNWEVKLLEAIYLLHLYSVFPQYAIVCKKRFFSMFTIRQSGRKQINVAEVVYIFGMVGICLVFSIFRIKINIIIDINGSVLGFCFIYLLPTLLHIKCLYFSKGKRHISELTVQKMFREDFASSIDSREAESVQKDSEPQEKTQELQIQLSEHLPPLALETPIEEAERYPKQSNIQEIAQQKQNTGELKDQKIIQVALKESKITQNFVDSAGNKGERVQQEYSYYYCGYRKPSTGRQVGTLTLLGVMFLMGAFIMVNGMIEVVRTIKGDN